MLWDRFIGSIRDINSGLVSIFGIPLWGISLCVIGLCVLYRFLNVLGQDEREARRRKKLLTHMHEYLDKSLGTNRAKLELLRLERITQLAEHYVRNIPVRSLLEIEGIGQKTVEALLRNNYSTFGDIIDRNIHNVRMVGNFKIDAVYKYISATLTVAKENLGKDYPISSFPLDKGIEEHFNQLERDLLDRQKELGHDLESLITFDDQLVAFEQTVRRITLFQRLQQWFTGIRESIRYPIPALSFVALLMMGFALLFFLPFILLAWSVELFSFVVFCGTALGLLGIHVAFLIYFILADEPVSLGSRPPAPDQYAEQLLQFKVLRMATEIGIAPPVILIQPEQGMSIWSTGRSDGPSAIVVDTGLTQNIPSSHLDALLAREIGELARNSNRLEKTIGYFVSPVEFLYEKAVEVSAAFWDKLMEASKDGKFVGMLVFFTLFVCSLPFFLTFAALRFVFAVLDLALSRRQMLVADQAGTRLVGKESMSKALQYVENLVHFGPQGEDDALQRAGLRVLQGTDRKKGISSKKKIEYILHTLGSPKPTIQERIEALDSGLQQVGDLLKSFLRVGIVTLVSVALLWTSVYAAKHTTTYTMAYVKKKLNDEQKEKPSRQEVISTKPLQPGFAALRKPCTMWIPSNKGKSISVGKTAQGSQAKILRKLSHSSYVLLDSGKKVWLENKCMEGAIAR